MPSYKLETTQMSEMDFIRSSLGSLHSTIDEALEGLTQDQAHWRPGGEGNHIAFIAWHYSRTVDNIVRFVLQRRPTVWMEGKWDERFGLDSKAQGTGMSREEAVALRVSDIPAFGVFMKEVWRETQTYLGTITEEDLGRTTTIRPHGEITLEQVLGSVLLTHGYTHLGEIWLLNGLQGLRGNPI